VHRKGLIIFVLLVLALPARAVDALESIARIRALSPEDAARGLPAAIEGVVTFRNPAQQALIAYDGAEGIYVSLPKDLGAGVVMGSRVRIEGITQPGGFLPIIACRQIAILGTETLPEPRRISPAELYSPSLDCQWVQVPGIITALEPGPEVILVAEVSGWTAKLVLPDSPDGGRRAMELLQRPVTIRGVVGSVFNAQRQLTGRHFFVPSFDFIVPSEIAPPDAEPQLRAMDELLRSDATARTRVRVRGVVTSVVSDGLYLRGEGGSVFARAVPAAGIAIGTRVEAEGFAAVAPFRPILRATRVTPLENGTPPAPQPLDLTGGNITSQQAELVSVEADLLARREGRDGETVLQCRAGSWFFEAVLPARAGRLRGVDDNDRARLTGICELSTTTALPFSGKVEGLRLHLRDAGDVAVLRHAPWWTLQRLLWALAGVCVLALLALAWAAQLRRRVSEQTEVIGSQIERAAVKDERQRIARELHDTIEQDLAGLSIQLRNARQRLASTPERAVAALELAERMLRHCREETRTSIADLRSVTLEQRGLPGALEELLPPVAAAGGARFALEVQGSPRSLAGPVELHLLRIAQEAVANAARHSQAQAIRARLEYGADAVTLEIRDDGRGFDPAAPTPRGHFGLLGIRERAAKVHGKLTLESSPGAGSMIRVSVPADFAARSNGHSSS
jgi:signal transduction histidine kinase